MPGEQVVGELVTKLTADVGDYKRGMGDARDEMDKTGDAANKMDMVLKGAVAGFALMAAAAAAGAVKLFELGSSFDDAYDRIRVGTGKTGEALEALQEDFRQVAANVPASFETVSTAIAELHQRTGLVGPELQELSTQLIQFSRVTGTDLSQNIALSTRMFGDWSISTDKQAESMDKVMRASQASGIATDRLMQLIVQFGGPLRQFGFSFEESAAMLSKWEKEGVNVELVMGSMRIAIGHFAREGVDLREGLTQTIEKIKGMEDGSQAAALAMQVFGARAGPDMAAAIREGRFDFEEYLDLITNGADTVLAAAEDTADAAEKWQMFSNKVALALEPLAASMFSAASAAADILLPALLGIIQAAAPLAQAFGDTLGLAFKRFGDALAPVGQQIATVHEAMKQFMEIEGLDPLTAGLQALRDTLYTTFGPETARLFERVTQAIGDFFKKLGEGLAGMGDAEGDMSGFVTAVEKISGAVNSALDAVTPFVDMLTGKLGPALAEAGKDVDRFRENMEKLGASGESLNPLDQALKALALTIGQTFGPDAQSAFETFTSAIGTMNAFAVDKLGELGAAFAGLIPLVEPALTTISNLVQAMLAGIAGFFSSHSEELQSIVTGLWNALKGIIDAGLQLAFAPIKVALQVLSGDFEGAWATINSAAGAAFAALGGVIQAGLNVVLQLIKGAIGEWTGQFTSLGASIPEGVAAGIAGAAGKAAAAARSMVQGAYDAARAFIQPGSPSHLFRDEVGKLIGEGVAVGIDLSSELVMNAIGKMTESMLTEAWRPVKSDQFGQMGYALLHQLAEAMEKGTPTAIQAVEKTGVAIMAELKKMLPPEEAERISGEFMVAVGAAIRGDTEALAAVGAQLDGMRDLFQQFAHEKHGEQLATSIADSIAAPSSKEKLARAGADAMKAFRDAIENESDATVAAAGKSFARLTQALREALSPEAAEEAIRQFKATMQQGFDEKDPAWIAAAEDYFGVILEEAEYVRKQDEGGKIARSIVEAFTKSTQRDAMSRASYELMSAMEIGIRDGGAKAEKAVETAVGKWATAMRDKLPQDILMNQIDRLMLLAEQAWETGDDALLAEMADTINEMENQARAIERSDAITKAMQGVGDKISGPDVVERFRRGGENLMKAVEAALNDENPKLIAAATKVGEDLIAQLNKALPPEEARALSQRFYAALETALREQTPEAVAALQAVQDEMSGALRASQVPKDARDMMTKVADAIASAEFKSKAGAGAADMMDAVRDRIREKTPQTEAAIIDAATKLGIAWKEKLKPEEYAAKMAQLWDLITAATEGGGQEALDALMKFFLGSEKAWDEYNGHIAAKVAATPQPGYNSNFGANSTTPPGGQTPPGTNSGNLPGSQGPSVNPGNSGTVGGTPGLPNPVAPGNTNLYWHQHPMYIIGSGGNQIPAGQSPSHQHGDSGKVMHNHADNHYGYAQGYALGGVITGPTMAMLGDNPSGIEAAVPLERAQEFGFGGGDPDEIAAALAAVLTRSPIRAYVSQSDLMGTQVDATRRGFYSTTVGGA